MAAQMVDGVQVSERHLTRSIDRTVRQRTDGQVHGLVVSVSGRIVVLSGTANSYHTKQLATHAALDVADVELRNDIVVN